MNEIDFLPNHYRQQSANRKGHAWRGVVIALFGGLLLLISGWQYRQRQAAEQALANIMPHYQLATSNIARIQQLQSALVEAEKAANWYAYLDHPWPRSQVIAAVVGPMPENVSLTELRIEREAGGGETSRRPVAGPQVALNTEAAPPQRAATERDLTDLRRQCDDSRIVVHLAGAATETATLNRYFTELAEHPLIRKATLDSMESTRGENTAAVRFRGRLEIAPGYGQKGHTPQALRADAAVGGEA